MSATPALPYFRAAATRGAEIRQATIKRSEIESVVTLHTRAPARMSPACHFQPESLLLGNHCSPASFARARSTHGAKISMNAGVKRTMPIAFDADSDNNVLQTVCEITAPLDHMNPIAATAARPPANGVSSRNVQRCLKLNRSI